MFTYGLKNITLNLVNGLIISNNYNMTLMLELRLVYAVYLLALGLCLSRFIHWHL